MSEGIDMKDWIKAFAAGAAIVAVGGAIGLAASLLIAMHDFCPHGCNFGV
jgi:hypothetical protein